MIGEDYVSVIAANDLGPCVAKSLSGMTLIILVGLALVFPGQDSKDMYCLRV